MSNYSFRATELVHGADYNPDQWTDYPEIIDEDFRLMDLASMNSASIGIFAWKKLEPEEGVYNFEWLDSIMDRMAETGRKVILATPSGARPAWMDRNHPECLRVSENRVRNLHGIRHNHCFTSPYYRKKTAEMSRILAERYGKHPALYMWHVSNEYSGECHCPLCQEAFRNFLRKRYHNNIEELNQQWWTAFWSHGYSDFNEIESPSDHGENHMHGLNLDWKRFVSEQTIDFFRNESAPLREITPNIPVTTNLMPQCMSFDQYKIAEYMDIISWDSYPEWGREHHDLVDIASETEFSHDQFRSLKKQPFYLMESTPSVVNWRPINRLKAPGVHELSSIQAIAHGSDSVQYFQWRKSRGSSEKLHGAVVDHYGKEDTRVFSEVSALGKVLKNLKPIAGSDVKPQCAVIYDWENAWAIEDIQGWRTPKLYNETVMQHHRALRSLGLDVDVIAEENSFADYQLVVAPMLYMTRAGIATRLKEFTANGGTLLLTYGAAEVNENDLCHLGGFPGEGLMEVAGLRAEEMDTLYDDERNGLSVDFSDCEFEDYKFAAEYRIDSFCERIIPFDNTQVLATYTDDFYAGEPVLTRNVYGKGECYYLAARASQSFLNDLYAMIANEIGLEPALKLDHKIAKLPEGISATKRYGADGTEYSFILNFSEEPQKLAICEGSYTNLANGETIHVSKDEPLMLKRYGYVVLVK